jgi:integrase
LAVLAALPFPTGGGAPTEFRILRAGLNRTPIHPEAVPYLLHAIATSPLPQVFVHPEQYGEGFVPYRHDHDLAENLRAAMRRAGVGVTHYSHTCRRCGHAETSADGLQRFCSTCCTKAGRGVLLYPHIHVAQLKFHDTRHTTGTLLAQKGVAIKAIQELMLHSDQRMTEKYLHAATGWLREELAKISFAAAPPEPAEPIAEAARAAGGFVTLCYPRPSRHKMPSLPRRPFVKDCRKLI